MKPLARLLPALAAGAALVALLSPAPSSAADVVDEEVAAFKTYLGTKPPSDGLKNKIAEIAQKKDPRVADALLPLLSPKYDEEVRIAVCQNLGKQGSTKVLGPLVALVEAKDADEKYPKLVAAAMEGIGDAAPAAKYEYLVKMGNKYLDISGDISAAAWKGVGNNNTHQAVDDLVKAAVRCDASGGDNPVPEAVRTNRGIAKGVIMNCLEKITGKDIKDSAVWNKWWRENKKTWKPTPAGKDKSDINASDLYKDDAYAFSIKRPSKAWMFRKGDGHGPYMKLEAMDEGSPAAWVEVYVESVKGKNLTTPEQFADADKGLLEPKFRDLKEAVWGKKCAYGGAKGIEVILLGDHKDYSSVHMHNVYIEKSEIMYRFLCIWKSGKSQALKDDMETMLKSGIKIGD